MSLRTNHLPQCCVNNNASTYSEHCHVRLISILKTWEDPTLPSSYRPMVLPDTSGKLCGKTVPNSILSEISKRGLLLDDLPTCMAERSKIPSRATNTHCCLRAGVLQGGLVFPTVFSLLCQRHACSNLSCSVGLYVSDMTIIATSRTAAMLVRHLDVRDIVRVAERMEDCHQSLKEHCDNVRKGPQAHPHVPRANPSDGKRPLSGGDPRYTGDLISSHLSA